MGKRFLPIAWVLSVLSAGFVYLSERYHFMPFEQNYQIQADYIDLVIIVIFLTITTCIFWIVMNVIEKTILRVLSSERRVKDAYDLTLEGWARALEMRDKETEGHSRRVTELTMKIGRQMAFSEEELIHVRRGALLHDIGKMAIPDSILHKPGELTEEEWTLVRKHPLQAYEMLKDIDFLEQAMDIPLYHHEQWDGNGYPYGLAGEEIPLPARIFAVVDNWDALCSDRAYRPAWEREEAISYIKEQAGKKFDPEVTKVFLRVI
jgi:putative nucleotidyltransferase with HDIG domain